MPPRSRSTTANATASRSRISSMLVASAPISSGKRSLTRVGEIAAGDRLRGRREPAHTSRDQAGDGEADDDCERHGEQGAEHEAPSQRVARTRRESRARRIRDERDAGRRIVFAREGHHVRRGGVAARDEATPRERRRRWRDPRPAGLRSETLGSAEAEITCPLLSTSQSDSWPSRDARARARWISGANARSRRRERRAPSRRARHPARASGTARPCVGTTYSAIAPAVSRLTPTMRRSEPRSDAAQPRHRRTPYGPDICAPVWRM